LKTECAAGVTNTGSQVEMYVDNHWRPPRVGFALEVTSAYLASLTPSPSPASCGGRDPLCPVGRYLARTERGLEGHYPPGESACPKSQAVLCRGRCSLKLVLEPFRDPSVGLR
jgi:hypothetical protein